MVVKMRKYYFWIVYGNGEWNLRVWKMGGDGNEIASHKFRLMEIL